MQNINPVRKDRSQDSRVTVRKKRIVAAIGKRVLLLAIIVLAALFGISYYRLFSYQTRLVKILQLAETQEQGFQAKILARKADEQASTAAEKEKAENAPQKKPQDRTTLLEVVYLVRLADMSVYQHDEKSALHLLSMAENKLKKYKDSGLENVRALLAANISDLNAMPQADRLAAYRQLQAVNDELNALPTADQALTLIAESPKKKLYPESGWRSLLRLGWKSLNKAIMIRHTDREVIQLTVAERDLIRLNLHLLLTQSQSALMQRQPNVYQSSLSRAKQLILSYYDTNHLKVKSVLAEIETLKNEPLFAKMPDVDKTLDALIYYIR